MSEETVVVETPKVEVVVAKEEIVELTPIEQQAVTQGWVPKDEWVEAGNDPDGWRPAKEFVDRGELYKTIHTTRRELKQAQASLSALQRHHQYVFEKAQRQALDQLKQERRAAIRQEDIERAEAIEDEIEELQKTHQQEKQVLVQEQVQAQQQAGPMPEYQQWVDQNAWYLTDSELQEFADVTGIVYAKKNPGADPKVVLRHIEQQTKKQFPEKFGIRKAAPNPTAAVDRTSRRSTKAGDDVELDETEYAIMKTLKESGVMTEAEYKAELRKVKGK